MGLGLELMAAAAQSTLLGTPQQGTGKDWEQDRASQRDHGQATGAHFWLLPTADCVPRSFPGILLHEE